MTAQIELKVVNRLRQVTAAMRQNGDNQVALIHSDADKRASEKLGQAQAVRPQVVGAALAEVQKDPAVADALFRLLDIKATLKSPGKVIISPQGSMGLLLQS
jgi:regulator of protease activity HflC (stomatin/prohibitin superfamily)